MSTLSLGLHHNMPTGVNVSLWRNRLRSKHYAEKLPLQPLQAQSDGSACNLATTAEEQGETMQLAEPVSSRTESGRFYSERNIDGDSKNMSKLISQDILRIHMEAEKILGRCKVPYVCLERIHIYLSQDQPVLTTTGKILGTLRTRETPFRSVPMGKQIQEPEIPTTGTALCSPSKPPPTNFTRPTCGESEYRTCLKHEPESPPKFQFDICMKHEPHTENDLVTNFNINPETKLERNWAAESAADSETLTEPKSESPTTTDSHVNQLNEDYCAVCLNGGDLLCCDRCPKVYHLSCHVPPLLSFPAGDWVCTLCRNVREPEMEYDCDNSRFHMENSQIKMSYGLSSIDQRRCEKLTLLLCCNALSGPFHEPVSPLVRHYYQIIKKPMDLSTIRRKLSKSSPLHYRVPEEFVSDVYLMFKNCAKFNYPDSEVAQAGHSLEAFFTSSLKDVFPEYDFSSLVHHRRQSGDSRHHHPLISKRKRKKFFVNNRKDYY